MAKVNHTEEKGRKMDEKMAKRQKDREERIKSREIMRESRKTDPYAKMRSVEDAEKYFSRKASHGHDMKQHGEGKPYGKR